VNIDCVSLRIWRLDFNIRKNPKTDFLASFVNRSLNPRSLVSWWARFPPLSRVWSTGSFPEQRLEIESCIMLRQRNRRIHSGMDSLVSLTHHVHRGLGLIYLIKEHKSVFGFFRIFLKKRTLIVRIWMITMNAYYEMYLTSSALTCRYKCIRQADQAEINRTIKWDVYHVSWWCLMMLKIVPPMRSTDLILLSRRCRTALNVFSSQSLELVAYKVTSLLLLQLPGETLGAVRFSS